MKSAILASCQLLWRPKVRWMLALGICPIVAYLVFRDIDWGSLYDQLQDFPVRYAIASLLLFSLATAIRAYRWQVLLWGEKIPFHRLLLIQNAGTGLNSISPIRLVSEAAQYALLTFRYRVRGELVAASLGVQRVLDFVIGALLLGVGLLFVPGLKGFAVYVLGAGLLAIFSILAVPLFIWVASLPRFSRLPLLASTSDSLRSLLRARLKLTFSLALTLAYWLTLGLSAWVVAYGMGIDISILLATLLVIATMTFVALIPSLPASVGTFEFVVYYLLTAFGVEPAEALGYALVIHAILFLPPIILGLPVLISWKSKEPVAEAENEAGTSAGLGIPSISSAHTAASESKPPPSQ